MKLATLHAQPYDIEAAGFYFESFEEYEKKAAKNKNSYGQAVEEYEFQFIDGSQWNDGQRALDCLGLELFFEIDSTWREEDIKKLEIMIEELGSQSIPRDAWEIEKMMEDCIFYFGDKKDLADDLLETYYPDLYRALSDSGAHWYFDALEFIQAHTDGSFGDGYYFESTR